MPTSITLRATKGSALTHNEVDDNFSNLKTTADAALPTASLGTGVAAALAVNVGSAGAFVTLNGALGTPSSGTLTNCTGLPAAGVVGTAAILGANTFTALQTITQASANAGIIASTGYSLTGSNATSMIDLAGTWNTSGNPVALKIAMTNTASGATSKFLSLLAGTSGTTEVFYINKAGGVRGGLAALCGFDFGTDQLDFTQGIGTYNLRLASNGFYPLQTNVVDLGFAGGSNSWKSLQLVGRVAWDSSGSFDTGIVRNAAGVVEVNNGTAGTYRDLKYRNVVGQTGYTEMVEMTAPSAPAANTARIYCEDNGSGKTRLMVIFPSGAAQQIAIEP